MSVRIVTIGLILSVGIIVGCQSPPEDPFPEAKVGGKLTPPPPGAGSCQFGWSYRSRPFAKGLEKGQFFAVDVLADDDKNIIAKRVFAMAGDDNGMIQSGAIRVTYTFQIPPEYFREPVATSGEFRLDNLPLIYKAIIAMRILRNYRATSFNDSSWIRSANDITVGQHPSRGRTFKEMQEMYLKSTFGPKYTAGFLYTWLIKNAAGKSDLSKAMLYAAAFLADYKKPDSSKEVSGVDIAIALGVDVLRVEIEHRLAEVGATDVKPQQVIDELKKAFTEETMLAALKKSTTAPSKQLRLDEMVQFYTDQLLADNRPLQAVYQAINKPRPVPKDVLGYIEMVNDLFVCIPFTKIDELDDLRAMHPVPFKLPKSDTMPWPLPGKLAEKDQLFGITNDGFEKGWDDFWKATTIKVKNLGNRVIQYEVVFKPIKLSDKKVALEAEVEE